MGQLLKNLLFHKQDLGSSLNVYTIIAYLNALKSSASEILQRACWEKIFRLLEASDSWKSERYEACRISSQRTFIITHVTI